MAGNPKRKLLERQYYLTHTTGTSASTPFGQLQRTYMVQYIQTNEAGLNAAAKAVVQRQPFDELEIRWAKVWLTTNGVTPPNNTYLSSHWNAIARKLGFTPSKYINDNMYTFFANAA
jgi:hypothetical protein